MKGSCRVFDRPRLFCSSRLSSSLSQRATMKSSTFPQRAPVGPRQPGARAGKTEQETAGQRRGNLVRRVLQEAPEPQPPEARQEPAEQRVLAVLGVFLAKAEPAEPAVPARWAEVLDSRAQAVAQEPAEQAEPAALAVQAGRAPSAAPRESAELRARAELAARAEAAAPVALEDLEARAGKPEAEARGERSTEPVCASSLPTSRAAICSRTTLEKGCA